MIIAPTLPITLKNPITGEKLELNARQQASICGLDADEKALVTEALTVNLDYVKNDLFRKASAERELFEEGPAIQAASTSWYHPMVDDELIAQSAPSSSLLTTAQEKHVFLRYNFARM
jgi:hypothetical protein